MNVGGVYSISNTDPKYFENPDLTSQTTEVISRGKYSGSARIRTQNSCVTVDHSNHVAKE